MMTNTKHSRFQSRALKSAVFSVKNVAVKFHFRFDYLYFPVINECRYEVRTNTFIFINWLLADRHTV